MIDTESLTADQLDGIACVHCGSTDRPMTPVDVHAGVQLFACSPAYP